MPKPEATAPAQAAPRGPYGIATLLLCGWLSGACGGALPTLHPAATLPQQQWSASAGLGAGIPTVTAAPPAASGGDTPAARGALRSLGVSPWAALRRGFESNIEAGLSTNGTSLQVDGRKALPLGLWALSAGLELRGTASSELQLDGERIRLSPGYGVGLPLLLGWQFRPDLAALWMGARARFDWTASLEHRGDSLENLHTKKLDGLLGLSLGVPPVWVRLELAAGYYSVSGEDPETRRRRGQQGLALQPAGALVTRF